MVHVKQPISEMRNSRQRTPALRLALATRLLLGGVLIVVGVVVALDRPSDLASSIPWLFVVLLLPGFGWASWRYLRPRPYLTQALSAATHAIRDGDYRATDASQSRMFGAHEPLQKAWRDFHSARDPQPAGDSDHWPATPSSVAAREVFTIQTALGSAHSKLPNALPGIFTAVGLLGTFVGIFFGLADIDLDAPSNERLEAIGQLMAGMSTAFLTSIVGITLSVWWLLEFRSAERALESALDSFLRVVDEAFPVETPHATLMRIGGSVEALEGVERTAEGIKGSVQQLGQDLSGALENHLRKYVTEPLQNLNTDLGQRQQEALERMVESFQNTLVSSVGERLNEFGEALRNASDHQVKAATKLGRFFDRLDEVSDKQTRLLQRTSEVAEVFESGLTRLVEAKEAMKEAGNSVRETAEVARVLIQDCQRQLEAQEKASEAAARSWDAQLNAMKNLRDDLHALATHLTAKVEEFRVLSAQEIGKVFHRFDSEMATVTDHLSGTLDALRDVGTQFLRATQRLPETVTGLRETTAELARTGDAQRDSISDGMRAFELASTRLVDGMDRGLSAAQSAFSDIPKLAEAMRSGNDEIARRIEELCSRLESLVQRTEESGGRTVGEIARLMDSADRASGRIESAAASMTNAIQALEEKTATGSEALTRAWQSTSDLAGTIESVRKQMTELADEYQPRRDALRETVEGTLHATKRSANSLEQILDLVRDTETTLRAASLATAQRLDERTSDGRQSRLAQRVETGTGQASGRAEDQPQAPFRADPSIVETPVGGPETKPAAVPTRPVARPPAIAIDDDIAKPEEKKSRGWWPFRRRR